MSRDIDFDELDKAVNSLMGNVIPDASDEDPKAKTLKINSTLQPGERPAYNRLDEVAKNIGNETLVLDGERTTVEDLDALQLGPAPVLSTAEITPTSPAETPLPVRAAPESPKQPLVPKPASGRFMDVVHPSSDMRTASSDNLPLIVPERNATVSAEPAIESTSVLQPKESSQSEAITPTLVTDSEPSIPAPVVEAPLTPFLPDAKVEKRPLGGVAPVAEEAATELSTEPTEEPKSGEFEGEKPASVTPGPFEEQTPSEVAPETAQDDLQKDVEASAATRIPPEAAESIRAVESGDTEKLSAAAQSGGFALGQLEDDSQSDGAIYDVDSQPQPLGHPTKQKSGWGTVIIILVVIILSAALGAAAYFILGLGA